jgi:hypothetical protein
MKSDRRAVKIAPPFIPNEENYVKDINKTITYSAL